MQIEILRTLSELENIADEWNQLLEKSANNVPFLRHEYLTTWWGTLGGGEWQSGELYIVLARNETGELIGIAPLFLTKNLAGQDALMFLGSIEISDYLDLIVAEEVLLEFVEGLLEHLTSPDAPPWEVLDWYNLLDDSPTLPTLEAGAKKLGLNYSLEKLQPSPRISLASDWEEYLLGIQGKQRREIRRKVRRAEGFYVPVEWYTVEDEDKLDDEIDAFLDLMAHDSEKDAFLTEVMRSQMRTSVHTAFREGWLQLSFLTVGDEKAAAYLNFDYANQIWVYNSGINFKFNELSPGWVLLAYLIEWAIDNGREYFDMMRGDEIYKYRFGGVDRFVMRAQIRR
ncbi:MAG: GNAT family N-acetyltransferase [Anaerolineales bacterium]|nr:GNAT family N-acetyltransferase [Chloroflexota bacterium]MBL6980258.1 GNAT family N-acetyltransferase [Anaerolineales bacterium]